MIPGLLATEVAAALSEFIVTGFETEFPPHAHQDQKLWVNNGSDTLRYLVMDELHTFDGAQGTDLSLLVNGQLN